VKVFAIADLHLSFGADKPMDIFGAHWENHAERLKTAWLEEVCEGDLVLIPGDISWSLKLEEARKDLDFIGELPGTKVIMRGNHDYWWSSLSKLNAVVHESIVPLQNTALVFGDIAVAGSRLWLDPDLRLEDITPADKKIWERELHRFSLSLKALPERPGTRIIMTHYPPISLDGKPGRAVQIARKYHCHTWVFGHMHLGDVDYRGFNCTIDGTRFVFVSSDFLDFRPRLIVDE